MSHALILINLSSRVECQEQGQNPGELGSGPVNRLSLPQVPTRSSPPRLCSLVTFTERPSQPFLFHTWSWVTLPHTCRSVCRLPFTQQLLVLLCNCSLTSNVPLSTAIIYYQLFRVTTVSDTRADIFSRFVH